MSYSYQLEMDCEGCEISTSAKTGRTITVLEIGKQVPGTCAMCGKDGIFEVVAIKEHDGTIQVEAQRCDGKGQVWLVANCHPATVEPDGVHSHPCGGCGACR